MVGVVLVAQMHLLVKSWMTGTLTLVFSSFTVKTSFTHSRDSWFFAAIGVSTVSMSSKYKSP